MVKRLFIKEASVATLLVLLVTYLISFIPFSQEYGKALHQGFADFDIYDLYYSDTSKQNLIKDKDIVLVEIGNDRSEIADQVKTLSRYSPKIIAIDATFEEPRDSTDDAKFSGEMKQHSNIVFATEFDKKEHFIPNIFNTQNDDALSGYIDFSRNPPYAVIRTYAPFTTIDGKQYDAFTSAIVRKVNLEKYQDLKKRNNNVELINYVGNLNNFLNVSRADLNTLDSQQLETLFKNKIVLIGFFVKDPPLILDDIYYSPLNEQVSGKSFPDMYGVVVHANILSMILNGRYANLASKTTSYFFAFLITFLLNLYFISRFHKKTHPAHSAFMLIQFLAILVVLLLFLLLFNWLLFKVPLEPIIIAMVLSLELLGLYKNIALWLHRKYHYETIFTHKHII
jgi:CHASE2 domain-containing sensor protein